ncbi:MULTISPECIES: DUF6538 domain-containing protein [Shewanella]|uniref:DUF6538 domain-containing protein n=1 Tax=Shewanella sp. 8A TaxID=2943323 RepID=UPI002E7B0076|nr:DUF6538 domain-containing protein [Shewanella xiamenensis]
MLQTVLQTELQNLPYTFQRNGIYYLRIRVPKLVQEATDLPPVIRQSLHTKSSRIARKIVANVISQFDDLRSSLVAKQIENTIQMGLITCLTGSFELKFEGNSLSEERKELSAFMKEYPQHFEAPLTKVIEVDECESKPTIAEMSKKWLESCTHLNHDDMQARIRHMALIVYLHGELSVDLNGAQVDELLSVSSRMPRGNLKDYKNKELSELMELALQDEVPDEDQITNNTHWLKTYQGFFRWLVMERVLDVSPMEKRRVKSKNGEDRGAFDIPTAKKIIDFAQGCERLHLKWSLLIMAYSGMRNNEIQKLTKGKVLRCPMTGIWYMQIQFGKTDASTRKIPIAEPLIQLGFMDYVNSFKNAEDRLFDVSERYLTSRYPEIRKQIGLPERDVEGNKLTLYSFRHTVISLIRANGANEFLSKAIAGHKSSKNGDGIHDKYSHIYLISLDKLKPLLDGLVYETNF